MQNQPFESSTEQKQDSNRDKVGDAAAAAPTTLSFLDVVGDRQSKATTPALDKSVPASGYGAVLGLRAAAQGADKACPESPVYNERLDLAARNMYDPSLLGDLKDLRSKYNCDIQRSGDPITYFKKAINLGDKEPYTHYLSPKVYKDMMKTQQGNEVGVGVSFVLPTADDDRAGRVPPLVVQEFDATKARGNGLKPGDQILAIDGVSMQGKTWREGSAALEGADRSKVNLHILRDGKESDVTLTRTDEPVRNVKSDMVDGKFAHIRVKTFMNDHTAQDIEREVLKHPEAEGYILDLRNNGGGLLDESMVAASVFIGEGKVLNIKSRVPSDPANPKYENDVYTVGPESITKSVDGQAPSYYAPRRPDSVHKPVVVLVDQGTASASEILTGALKDTDGAYVIGTPTYGKGIGQTIFPDNATGGATKMTTFRYLTPSGYWPGDGHNQRIGIKPDQYVPNPAPKFFNTARDGQIRAAADFLHKKTGK